MSASRSTGGSTAFYFRLHYAGVIAFLIASDKTKRRGLLQFAIVTLTTFNGFINFGIVFILFVKRISLTVSARAFMNQSQGTSSARAEYMERIKDFIFHISIVVATTQGGTVIDTL